MAAQYGILLGLETMETPFMNSVEKAMNVVNAVDSPYLMYILIQEILQMLLMILKKIY